MKISKLRKKTVALLALLGVIVGGLGIANIPEQSAMANNAEIVELSLNDVYGIGAEIVVPETVQISYKDKTYIGTNATIRYPDGSYYESSSCRLTLQGNYTIAYKFIADDGCVKTVEKTFKVEGTNWSVSSSSASCEWVENGFKNVIGASSKSSYTDALHVTLGNNDTFTYNVPIDISAQDRVNVLTMFPVNPAIYKGNYPLSYCIVKLTDVHDSSNYIELVQNFTSPGCNLPYLMAGASCGYRTGIEWANLNAPSVVYAGRVGKLHSGNDSQFGMSAQTSTSIVSYGVTWDYEDATKQVFYNHDGRTTDKNGPGSNMVTDLDAPEIYTAKENQFKGFTTGEVYFSLQVMGLTQDTVEMDIASICGISGEELKQAAYVDTVAPIVSVNAELENDSVYALQGEEIELFSATALDPNLSGDVTYTVYYNYGSDAQTSVSTKNNKFTPSKVGTYTVVYKAKDLYGNVGTKEVFINVVNRWMGEVLSERVNFEFLTDIESETYPAGAQIIFPAYTIEGINGNVSLEVKAVSPSGNEVKLNDDFSFVPVEVGEYKIICIYSDVLGSYEKEFVIESTVSSNVNFINTPGLPLYFIKGATYEIEDFYAHVYETVGEAQKVATMISAKIDDGEFAALNDNKLTVPEGNTLTLKYEYAGISYITNPMKIVDVNYGASRLTISEYFQGDFTWDSSSSSYVSNTRKGNNRLEFINTISLDTFSITFKIPKEALYSGIAFTLSDYYDINNKAILKLYSADGYVAFSINDGAEIFSSEEFASGIAKTISYKDGQFYLDGENGLVNTVDFASDWCFLDMELLNIDAETDDEEGKVAISISNVSNQAITKIGKDNAKPIIKAQTTYMGIQSLGTVVTVYKATVTDVYMPIQSSALKLTVRKPSGGYAVAVDGTIMNGTQSVNVDYQIQCTEYGTYKVSYSAEDEYKNVGSLNYDIVVVNRVPPTVTIEGGADEYTVAVVELGQKYTIKSIYYEDDITPTEYISVSHWIVSQDYQVVAWTDTLAFFEKGMYRVYYYVVDDSGNATVVYYNVRVE